MSSQDYLAYLTPDASVIYPSRVKLALLAIVSALFVAGSFALWSAGGSEYKIFAVLGWAFFGLAMLVFVSRLLRRVPSLILNDSGIFDNSSGHRGYFLRWEEIDSMYFSNIGRQELLSIRLKDPERFLSQQSAMKARMMRADVKLVGAPVSISASTLPIKLDELIRIIQQKAPTVRFS